MTRDVFESFTLKLNVITCVLVLFKKSTYFYFYLSDSTIMQLILSTYAKIENYFLTSLKH